MSCNNIYKSALEKIEHDQRYRNNCCCIIGTSGGTIGPTGPTGPTGSTGPTGPAGQDGDTPDFSIGMVTTGAPGTQAQVIITKI